MGALLPEGRPSPVKRPLQNSPRLPQEERFPLIIPNPPQVRLRRKESKEPLNKPRIRSRKGPLTNVALTPTLSRRGRGGMDSRTRRPLRNRHSLESGSLGTGAVALCRGYFTSIRRGVLSRLGSYAKVSFRGRDGQGLGPYSEYP